jgi:hypothetical protein
VNLRITPSTTRSLRRDRDDCDSSSLVPVALLDAMLQKIKPADLTADFAEEADP